MLRPPPHQSWREAILELTDALAGPRSKQRIRVLAGTWLAITDPAALLNLHKDKRVHLRIAKPPGFHVKHAAFRGARSVVTFTGSANFTAKGLGGLGELVAEVTDRVTSGFASTERDAFRRLWEDSFDDELTGEVIAAYRRQWKPKRKMIENGMAAGRQLLDRFGRRKATVPATKDDGSVYWFPIEGTLAPATEAALRREVAGTRADDFLGLGDKQIFKRIRRGARQLWVLDRRGKASRRNLKLQRISRELEFPTEADGRYFAVLERPKKTIKLTKQNRQRLKELGLVERIDSLSGAVRLLRAGKVRTLLAMSVGSS